MPVPPLCLVFKATLSFCSISLPAHNNHLFLISFISTLLPPYTWWFSSPQTALSVRPRSLFYLDAHLCRPKQGTLRWPGIYFFFRLHFHSLLFLACVSLWVILSISPSVSRLLPLCDWFRTLQLPLMWLLLIKPHFPPLKRSPKHKQGQMMDGRRVPIGENKRDET